MAIIENFYNNDRARDIREILTNNFSNVAKYIPNEFLILSSTERVNLNDDYKTHFKLVFDKERERVYRWSDIQRNWEQYLIYAWDEYARQEADTNTDRAFALVEIGVDENGNTAPYTVTFSNRKEETRGSFSITTANVKFNDNYSAQTIIQKLLDDLASLDSFVGERSDILNNSDLTATTVTGAIKEINNKTIENKNRLDDIVNGNTMVPRAQHSEVSDLATRATMAADSEKLGGQEPAYYAKQSSLDTTNTNVSNLTTRMESAESRLTGVENRETILEEDLANFETLENTRYNDYLTTKNRVSQLETGQTNLEDEIENINQRIGWIVLVDDEPVPSPIPPDSATNEYEVDGGDNVFIETLENVSYVESGVKVYDFENITYQEKMPYNTYRRLHFDSVKIQNYNDEPVNILEVRMNFYGENGQQVNTFAFGASLTIASNYTTIIDNGGNGMTALIFVGDNENITKFDIDIVFDTTNSSGGNSGNNSGSNSGTTGNTTGNNSGNNDPSESMGNVGD